MNYCVNHPDKETSYVCTKHDVYMCEDCMHCRDPEIYCKFRSSCPIHFLTKRKKNLDNEPEPVSVFQSQLIDGTHVSGGK